MSAEERDDLFPWEIEEATSQDASAPPATAAVDADVLRGASTLDAELASGRADARADDQRDAIDRSQVTRERPVAHKEYYSISEVCDLVDLKPHVLRYWETQFGPLNPSKNRSGNRVYQRKEIRLIMLVKQLLYDEKYTVEGAKAKLDQLRRTGSLQEMGGRALEVETVDMLRIELAQLARVLTLPPRS
ncbi:MAG: MerR family transcriptional regulator [Longimicrobiales bacterium]